MGFGVPCQSGRRHGPKFRSTRSTISLQVELWVSVRTSDSYSFDWIDPSYWIGAVVDWGGTASRDGRKVIDIRLVPPEVIPAIQP